MILDTPFDQHLIDENTLAYTVIDMMAREPFRMIRKLEPVDSIVPNGSGCNDCEHRNTCPALKMIKGRCRDWQLAEEIVKDRYDF